MSKRRPRHWTPPANRRRAVRLAADRRAVALAAGPRRGRFAAAAGGQSTVEVVAVLPLLIAVALAIGHVLTAGVARELAGHAAEAGAIAALRGGDAEAAVRAAVPEWARDRMAVRVDGRRVRVRLEPLSVIPGAADRLATTSVADAGSPDAVAESVVRGLEGAGR